MFPEIRIGFIHRFCISDLHLKISNQASNSTGHCNAVIMMGIQYILFYENSSSMYKHFIIIQIHLDA